MAQATLSGNNPTADAMAAKLAKMRQQEQQDLANQSEAAKTAPGGSLNPDGSLASTVASQAAQGQQSLSGQASSSFNHGNSERSDTNMDALRAQAATLAAQANAANAARQRNPDAQSRNQTVGSRAMNPDATARNNATQGNTEFRAPTPRGSSQNIVGPHVDSPEFYDVPILGGIKRATDAFGSLDPSRAINKSLPSSGTSTTVGDFLGHLMPPTNPETGAAIADNPLYALGPAGNFAGEIGPAVSGLSGAIARRLGATLGRGATVADEVVANTGRGASLPEAVNAETLSARSGAPNTAAQQAQNDLLSQAIETRTGANALTEATARSGAVGTEGLGLAGQDLRSALTGQNSNVLTRRLATQAARTGLAEDTARYAGSPIGDAIDSLIGRLPTAIKVGVPAAAAAGVLGATLPTNPEASTLPSDVNEHNPNSPITDAAIAAQNDAANGATPADATAPDATAPDVVPPASVPPTYAPPAPTTPGAGAPAQTAPVQIPANAGKAIGFHFDSGAGGNASPALPTAPTSSAELQKQVMDDLNGIAQQLAAGPQTPDVMAIFATQAKSIIDLINQQEAALRSQAEKDGSTIDPATQNTLSTLREELDRQLKQTMEALNSRGLLDSGILVEAQQMLRKGNLSDQAKILAERLSRIQQNLTNGLQNFANQRISTLSHFSAAGAQAQTQAEQAERARMDALRAQLIQGHMGLQGQAQQSEQFQSNQDFQAQQNEYQRQLAIATKNAELAAQQNDRQAQRDWEQQKMYLQEAIDRGLAQQQIDAGRYAPSQTSQQAATNAAATQHIVDQAMSAPSLEDALAALDEQQAELEAAGVDIAKAKEQIRRAWSQ